MAMAANSKFAVAVHALSVLGYFGDEPLTSEVVASSVNTNPVVVRRILGTLKRAGIVESQPGNRGGWRLARSAERITLADIYRALEAERFMSIHGNPENKKCPVSRNIKPFLETVLDSTEVAVDSSLKKTTLAELVSKIQKEEMG
jgi:Rrf2 family protein